MAMIHPLWRSFCAEQPIHVTAQGSVGMGFFVFSYLLIIRYLLVGAFAVACPLIHAKADQPVAGAEV